MAELKKVCPYCGSKNLEYISRVTGYYSKVNGWNKGKLAELKDRYRNEMKDGGDVK